MVLLAWHFIQHSICTLPFIQNTNPKHTTLTVIEDFALGLLMYLLCMFNVHLFVCSFFSFHFRGRWDSVSSCAPSVRTNFRINIRKIRTMNLVYNIFKFHKELNSKLQISLRDKSLGFVFKVSSFWWDFVNVLFSLVLGFQFIIIGACLFRLTVFCFNNHICTVFTLELQFFLFFFLFITWWRVTSFSA